MSVLIACHTMYESITYVKMLKHMNLLLCNQFLIEHTTAEKIRTVPRVQSQTVALLDTENPRNTQKQHEPRGQ